MSILFISHDLSLVRAIADRILVMYQGKIVEQGTSKTIFETPKEHIPRHLSHPDLVLQSVLKNYRP
ncbi:hypothetical protein BST94_09550 [Nonlabens xylanidelens]|nr:hypothetical protein BST94_09550 [Nonlabens xylanidelens]